MDEVTLKQGRARPVWAGHPWVMSGAIGSVTGEPVAGDTVRVRDHAGRPIGTGFFSPGSQIRVRMLTDRPEEQVDGEFLARRVRRAVALRESLLLPSDQTTAFRLVHGDGDRLPGTVADRYGDYLVLQLTVAGMERRRDELGAILLAESGARGVFLDPVPAFAEREGLCGAAGHLAGEELPREIEILECGVRMVVDPRRGQKTGHFADHRENRAVVRGMVRGGRVLDCFTGTGGFALAAALGGAGEVLALDSSAVALEAARRNAERNGVADRITFLRGDVFRLLRAFEREGRRFEAVVLDPPSMARSRSDLAPAKRGYKELNLRALKLIEPGGLLFTASCTGILGREDFDLLLRDAAFDAKRDLVILHEAGQAPDHPWPVAVPEARYLKFRAGRVE
jgi:23S rRNA (cytosine1962-C5)-methyltransferase